MPQRTFARPVEVQITGSSLIYDISDPLGGKGEPVKSLMAQFPDLRRFIREGYVRYAFTRFGVPYVVSIQCLELDAARRGGWPAARPIPVAERFLKALRVAGGQPSRPRMDIPSGVAERPLQRSPDFSYRPAGDIIANTGFRKQGGRADFTAYSQIRFPLEKAPAFAHSQSFMKRRAREKTDEPAGGNASYPWQDNFCEARSFGVGQCAGGFGHQGQDIRAGECAARKRRRRKMRSQAAGGGRGSRQRRDPLTEAAGGDAAGQQPHRAYPLPLHAHEPGEPRCRRRPQRTPSSRKAKKSAWSRTISTIPTAPAATCISTCRCSRATAGSGSIPTSP